MYIVYEIYHLGECLVCILVLVSKFTVQIVWLVTFESVVENHKM